MTPLLFTDGRGSYGTLEQIRQKWPAILWSDKEILAGTRGDRPFYVTDSGANIRLSRCRPDHDFAGLRNLYVDRLLDTLSKEECFQRIDDPGLPEHAREYLLRWIASDAVVAEPEAAD